MYILEIIKQTVRSGILDIHQIFREEQQANLAQPVNPPIQPPQTGTTPAATALAAGQYSGGELHQPPMSAEFLKSEGFISSVSSWKGGSAQRYFNAYTPTVSVVIGTDPTNFNQWQIWTKANGVVAAGAGQVEFDKAYANFAAQAPTAPTAMEPASPSAVPPQAQPDQVAPPEPQAA